MNISNEEYGELTKRRSHNSKLCRTIPMAFLIGGLICTLGEALLNLYGMAGLNKDEAGALTSITLVFLAGMVRPDRAARRRGYTGADNRLRERSRLTGAGLQKRGLRAGPGR